MKILINAGLATLLVCSASAASAATVYSTLAAFQSATSTTVESFENPYSVAASHVYSDFTISETGGVNAIGAGTPAFSSLGVITGTGSAEYDDNGSSLLVFDAFSSAFTAFGLWITSVDDATVTVDGTQVMGGLFSANIALTAGISSFIGVTDVGGILDITFDVSGGPNVAVDDVYTGSIAAVPVPASLPLLFGALGVVAMLRRRKKV